MQLASGFTPEPPEPQRVPDISRGLGAVFSGLFFFLGLIVEGMKMPHPELMNGGEYVECF